MCIGFGFTLARHPPINNTRSMRACRIFWSSEVASEGSSPGGLLVLYLLRVEYFGSQHVCRAACWSVCRPVCLCVSCHHHPLLCRLSLTSLPIPLPIFLFTVALHLPVPPRPSPLLCNRSIKKGGLECRFCAGIARRERHPSLCDRLLAVHGGVLSQQSPARRGGNRVFLLILGGVLPDRSSRRLDPGR